MTPNVYKRERERERFTKCEYNTDPSIEISSNERRAK